MTKKDRRKSTSKNEKNKKGFFGVRRHEQLSIQIHTQFKYTSEKLLNGPFQIFVNEDADFTKEKKSRRS